MRYLKEDEIIRMPNVEKKYGIKDLNICAYFDDDDLNIVGEIIADSISESFSLKCSVYDEDGDMIESIDNTSYGSCLVTSNIKPEVFFNGYPFKFYQSMKDESRVSKIRIVPN